MSCSGPRRMDAPDEWFGSAGPPPARLAGNADHFHHRARRSVNAPDRTRRGSFCALYKTVRERGSGKGYSEGSRRLGRDKYARARGFSDNFGQPNCVILRENSKATILPKQRILRDAQNVRDSLPIGGKEPAGRRFSRSVGRSISRTSRRSRRRERGGGARISLFDRLQRF